MTAKVYLQWPRQSKPLCAFIMPVSRLTALLCLAKRGQCWHIVHIQALVSFLGLTDGSKLENWIGEVVVRSRTGSADTTFLDVYEKYEHNTTFCSVATLCVTYGHSLMGWRYFSA